MEFLDLYNALGEPLGRSEERGIVHAQDLLHKAVQVWIINHRNELLLQRRSPDKVLCPNMLDVSFAGHISAGETPAQAVVREGKEELGIEVSLNNLEYLFSYREHRSFNQGTYLENEISDIFLYRADIPLDAFIFTDGEVAGLQYLPVAEVEAMWEARHDELVLHEEQFRLLFHMLRQRLSV